MSKYIAVTKCELIILKELINNKLNCLIYDITGATCCIKLSEQYLETLLNQFESDMKEQIMN